jgi:DNA processing protein
LDPQAYWIGFNLVRGIGAVRLRAILDHFGSLEIAWHAPVDALSAAGLSQKIIENLIKVRGENLAERAWEYTQRKGIQVLTWDDAEYPQRLKQIDQPPPVIYVRGTLTALDDYSVAIVGTRRVTGYGRQVTDELASCLARSGITVVSGLARGVDGVAHDSALKAGGRTFAVLGSGVDVLYPPEHRALAERIIQQGALISDYAPATAPDAANFPPRNRIISGLSRAVVIVEAGETSGALITATFAAEQGRDVFAVPGTITAPQSKGTNRLIRDGAIPMLKPEDVLQALALEQAPQQQQARLALPADEIEAGLLRILADEALHIDEICVLSGLRADQVSAALVMMELKGMVRGMGGMKFGAVHDEPGIYSV